jgi:hypothetical protein
MSMTTTKNERQEFINDLHTFTEDFPKDFKDHLIRNVKGAGMSREEFVSRYGKFFSRGQYSSAEWYYDKLHANDSKEFDVVAECAALDVTARIMMFSAQGRNMFEEDA